MIKCLHVWHVWMFGMFACLHVQIVLQSYCQSNWTLAVLNPNQFVTYPRLSKCSSARNNECPMFKFEWMTRFQFWSAQCTARAPVEVYSSKWQLLGRLILKQSKDGIEFRISLLLLLLHLRDADDNLVHILTNRFQIVEGRHRRRRTRTLTR